MIDKKRTPRDGGHRVGGGGKMYHKPNKNIHLFALDCKKKVSHEESFFAPRLPPLRPCPPFD